MGSWLVAVLFAVGVAVAIGIFARRISNAGATDAEIEATAGAVREGLEANGVDAKGIDHFCIAELSEHLVPAFKRMAAKSEQSFAEIAGREGARAATLMAMAYRGDAPHPDNQAGYDMFRSIFEKYGEV